MDRVRSMLMSCGRLRVSFHVPSNVIYFVSSRDLSLLCIPCTLHTAVIFVWWWQAWWTSGLIKLVATFMFLAIVVLFLLSFFPRISWLFSSCSLPERMNHLLMSLSRWASSHQNSCYVALFEPNPNELSKEHQGYACCHFTDLEQAF